MPYAREDLIERIAAKQRGVVTRAQLLERGVTRHVVDGRVRAGRLHLLHRGVYRVGPVEAPYTRELAGILACGKGAVVSHRNAGWLWKLIPDPGDARPVDLTVPHGWPARRPGIRLHRASLQPDEVTQLDGIPLTTPVRTLVDIATVLPTREVENALAQAERLNLLDRRDLLARLAKQTRKPGTPLLRMLLARETGPAFARSEAEERLLVLIRKAQLPAPETNVRVGSYEVDFYWRRERVVVEVDGHAFHSTKRAFENDRRRDSSLAASGIRVMRVTWNQLTSEPEAMLVRLGQALVRADGER